MKTLNILLCAFILALSVNGLAFSQDDLGKQISKVAGNNAVNYLTPMLSGLGADLNSGFYHSADLHDVLGFDLGLKVGAALMKDDEKTFDFIMPDTLYDQLTGLRFTAANGDYDKVIKGSPTAVGDESGIPVKLKKGAGQTIYTTPPGFNLKAVPLVVPQVAIGLPLGLEVIGRFIPSISLGDAGKVNFLGFGLRHDIDQYIPLFPIDVSIHFVTQKLTLSDKNDKKLMTASATAYGMEISKKLAVLTLYGGYQIERSNWDIEPYSFNDPSVGSPVTVAGFSIEGKNKSRFHAGIRLLLVFLNVHADYSFSTHPVATLGAGITFR